MFSRVGSSNNPLNFSIKIDHEISAKNRIFGEWLYDPGQYDNYRLPWTGPTFPRRVGGIRVQLPASFPQPNCRALGNTYMINPTLINEFRAGFSRQFMDTNLNQPYPESVSDQVEVQKLLAPAHIPFQPYTPRRFSILGHRRAGSSRSARRAASIWSRRRMLIPSSKI